MGRVFAEAAKKRKRAERLGLIAVCAASFVLVVLAVLGMLYTKIVFPSITMPGQPVTIFYLFIAALVALLLFADYKLRVLFRRKQQKSESE